MLAAINTFWQRLRPRLTNQWQAQLAFVSVGTVNSMLLMRLPSWLSMIEKNTWPTIAVVLLWQIFIGTMVGLAALLIFHIFVENGASIIERPLRFVLILIPASFAATFIGAPGAGMVWPGHPPVFPMRPADFVGSWLEIMLWGCLLIWLYCLYLQKQQDHLHFTALLGKRALLARQLAKSELLAARAQIDPQLLTRILRLVHEHHANAPDEANALLDQLIAYLRMAMNRKRVPDSSHTLQDTMDEAMQAMLASANQLENHTL